MPLKVCKISKYDMATPSLASKLHAFLNSDARLMPISSQIQNENALPIPERDFVVHCRGIMYYKVDCI